jgi:hypothetical protein
MLACKLTVQFTESNEFKEQACVDKGNMQKASIRLQFLTSHTCWTVAADAKSMIEKRKIWLYYKSTRLKIQISDWPAQRFYIEFQ